MCIQKRTVFFLLFVFSVTCVGGICYALSEQARDKGFVYLHEVDPTILVSVRYATSDNFVGQPVDGYTVPVIITTLHAAQALHKVQQNVKKDGYCLVVYDAYRPQQAVDYFISWSTLADDQRMKHEYYPRVDKREVFTLGYIAKRSGHSRGSTFDLTLIRDGQNVHPIEIKERVLSDGFSIKFLDDGTVDMGSSFDLLDIASHTATDLIDSSARALRIYLKNVMKKHGFKNYSKEWWHFTLKNEPFPADREDSYFGFPVE